ncbi:MAG: phosphopantetheine-binding protein [Bacteroidota bacterium]
MKRNAILKDIVHILTEYGLEEKQIIPKASFSKDLGFDSLDTVELSMRAEQHFDIGIPVSMLEENGDTIGGLIEIIEEQLLKE